MEKNLRSLDQCRPLSEAELAVYADVVAEFRKSYKINCTGCNYCLPCPKGVNIPACFSAYNTSYAQGYNAGMTLYVTSAGVITSSPAGPRLCNQCGKCEMHCPQNIPIRKVLKQVGRRFESPPLRILLALIRRTMTKVE